MLHTTAEPLSLLRRRHHLAITDIDAGVTDIFTAGYIEAICKITANSYTLAESSYYAVESGKNNYNTIQSRDG